MTVQLDKKLAQESSKIQRARRKLERQLQEWDRQVTDPALKKVVEQMRKWIADHAAIRISLKEKGGLCLFDQNRNTADLSQRVQKLQEKLSKDLRDCLQT